KKDPISSHATRPSTATAETCAPSNEDTPREPSKAGAAEERLGKTFLGRVATIGRTLPVGRAPDRRQYPPARAPSSSRLHPTARTCTPQALCRPGTHGTARR